MSDPVRSFFGLFSGISGRIFHTVNGIFSINGGISNEERYPSDTNHNAFSALLCLSAAMAITAAVVQGMKSVMLMTVHVASSKITDGNEIPIRRKLILEPSSCPVPKERRAFSLSHVTDEDFVAAFGI